MRYYYLDFQHPGAGAINLYKGINLKNLTKRKVSAFVRNGSDWLVESNGKLFTNVLDSLEPKYGSFIQYTRKYCISKPHIFRRIVELLKAGKYITSKLADNELSKLKEWESERARERNRDAFMNMANDVGIRLTKSQKEKVDKFLRSGQNQGMVVGKPIAVFAASTNGKIKICKK